VAEGVKSCRSILALAQEHGIDMPITEHVEQVVHEGVSVRDMVGALMARGSRAE